LTFVSSEKTTRRQSIFVQLRYFLANSSLARICLGANSGRFTFTADFKPACFRAFLTVCGEAVRLVDAPSSPASLVAVALSREVASRTRCRLSVRVSFSGRPPLGFSLLGRCVLLTLSTVVLPTPSCLAIWRDEMPWSIRSMMLFLMSSEMRFMLGE
jgi:hypothetical protein